MRQFQKTPPDSKDWKVFPYQTERYPRGEYLLADGTILIVEFVMKKIKVSGKTLPNGEPELQFQMQTLPTITIYTKDEGYTRLEK